MSTTHPITSETAVAHECEYRAREARDVVRDWHATSDPVKRAILEDCAKSLDLARAELTKTHGPQEPAIPSGIAARS
jgi:hypothetical protein